MMITLALWAVFLFLTLFLVVIVAKLIEQGMGLFALPFLAAWVMLGALMWELSSDPLTDPLTPIHQGGSGGYVTTVFAGCDLETFARPTSATRERDALKAQAQTG